MVKIRLFEFSAKNNFCPLVIIPAKNPSHQSDFIIESKDDLDKQTLDLELIRLQSLLDRYVQEESYEKARIIKRKIEIIKNKYDKLD